MTSHPLMQVIRQNRNHIHDPQKILFHRYHLAQLNLLSKALNHMGLPNQTYVMDATSVGFQKKMVRLQQAFQEPNTKQGGEEPSRDLTHLVRGCVHANTMMIVNPKMRYSIPQITYL